MIVGVGYYNFPRSTNKIKSFDEILTSEKIIIFATPAAIKFFHQILKNGHFGVKKNHYPCRWICMTHIKAPTLFPRGILIFQGALTKFNF